MLHDRGQPVVHDLGYKLRDMRHEFVVVEAYNQTQALDT